MQCLCPPWLIPTGGLWLCAGSLSGEMHTGSTCPCSVNGQKALNIQDLLGEELKSEAASESSSVHMHCTTVAAAKAPG